MPEPVKKLNLDLSQIGEADKRNLCSTFLDAIERFYCDCDALRNKVVNDFALVKKFVEEYPDEEDYPDYF